VIEQRIAERPRLAGETAKHANVFSADLPLVTVRERCVGFRDELGQLVGIGGSDQGVHLTGEVSPRPGGVMRHRLAHPTS